MSEVHIVSGTELWQWRLEACRQAKVAEVPEAEVDWLLQQMADLDRLSLRLESFKDQAGVGLKRSLSELSQLWQQRIKARIPIQYLAGVAPWRRFSLMVSPAVLIPRPETEILLDLAVMAASQCRLELTQGHWADLGTGSGAIALGLAEVFPQATIHAVDASAAALAIAQHNAHQLGYWNRIRFCQGSWFEPLLALQGNLSGMVSNPPYIPSSMIPNLQPEVALHEPHVALDGGADGLDCLRHLVDRAPNYLKPGGIWLSEMMAGQAEAVAELLQHQGSYRDIEIYADLAGIDRFALAFRV
jgi:release factor glutamine methyltransferase